MIRILLLVLPVVVHTQYCAYSNDVYDKARNTCYHFSNPYQLDFKHAGIYCSNLQYKLLSIHSKEQNDFVANLSGEFTGEPDPLRTKLQTANRSLENRTDINYELKGPYLYNVQCIARATALQACGSIQSCFLLAGGYRDEDSQNFLWSDGSFWNYTNWMTGEPIYEYMRLNVTSGKWSTDSDHESDETFAICEGPSVSTPKMSTSASRPLQTTQMSAGASSPNSTAPSATSKTATTVRAVPAQVATTAVKHSDQHGTSPKVITTTTGKATGWSLSEVAVFFVLLLSYHY